MIRIGEGLTFPGVVNSKQRWHGPGTLLPPPSSTKNNDHGGRARGSSDEADGG